MTAARADVLFIHPGAQKKLYQGLAQEFTAIAPPVWTALLAERVRRDGLSPLIYDANLQGWDRDVAESLLSRHSPAAIVLMVYGHHPSASTQTMAAAGRIARDLKAISPDAIVVMGGLHPSALPERTLREEAVDFIVQGEGVRTLTPLIRSLQGSGTLKKVPGFWFLEGDETVFTGPAELIFDLDGELGEYAWDLIPDLAGYRAHNMHCFQDFSASHRPDFSDVRSPYATLQTSLGCPFNCSYCCTNSLFGGPGIRYWSLPTVLGWIDRLAGDFGVRNIRLDDELFILDESRVERFCDLLLERAYDLNLWAYGRVDTINPRLLEKMQKAGFNWLCLGIESAVERVRKGVNKKYRGDIRAVVASIQGAGISVLGNFMFGLPDDDLDSVNQTLKLAMDLNCEFVNFYSVMAYPGSQLFREALDKMPGELPRDWTGFSQHSPATRPLPTRHLTARQVLEFRDKAFEEYFRRPAYLALLEEKFGNKVTEHIQRMLAIKIVRNPW